MRGKGSFRKYVWINKTFKPGDNRELTIPAWNIDQKFEGMRGNVNSTFFSLGPTVPLTGLHINHFLELTDQNLTYKPIT